MASQNIYKKIIDGIDGFASNVQWNGKSILKGNDAINPLKTAGKFVIGETNTGIRGTLNAMSKGDGFMDAVKGAYTKNGSWKDPNIKAIAGTYVGAAAAGRVLTGGGIYRDSTGNVNVPVVPFI